MSYPIIFIEFHSYLGVGAFIINLLLNVVSLDSVEFFTTAWSLWYRRDLVVFQNKHIVPAVAVQNSLNLLKSYHHVHSQRLPAVRERFLWWKKTFF